MGAEADPLLRNGRIGHLGGAFGDPAGELDVGLQASRIQARVEVAVLDRPPLLEDVSVIEADPVAGADPVGEVAEVLGVLELPRTHRAAPAVAVTGTPVLTTTAAAACGEAVHQVLCPGADA